MDVYQTAPEKDHSQRGKTVGEMQKRRETMADGRRYLIYYTFNEVEQQQKPTDKEEGEKDV